MHEMEIECVSYMTKNVRMVQASATKQIHSKELKT